MGIFYSQDNVAFESIRDKLKPTLCKSCRADGYTTYGACEECLRNQAYNKEYVETHLFICDDMLERYHEGGRHNTFKCMPYRKPNEKPYLYYGIEIEVSFDEDYLAVNYQNDDYYDDSEETSDDCAQMLREFSEITGGLFIYERDGSLTNGVEFISRPMSYAQWTDKDTIKKIEDGMELLKKWGAFKEQPDTNGLHIHISRKFFDYGDAKREDREKMYQDMDWLFQYYQPELEKIGGRQYTQFCESKMSKIKSEYGFGTRSRSSSQWNVELEVKGKMKKGGCMARGDHYSAVIESGNTIEARIFNSTLDTTQIIGNIELMRNFAHAVRNEEITGKTLNNILHTKDNLYLDKLLAQVRTKCYKDKVEFDLEKVEQDEMEIK